jgi:type III restriction enzyme
LILSEYKQAVAAKHRIYLKPVLLLKAQKTIAQSKENKANFHRIIDSLNGRHIARIRISNVPIIQRAFRFFEENQISDEQLAERLKREFHEDFCLSVNDDEEKENYQILVNTLEDRNNRIRAIFAVQKLNEGWDVLNLFDIVRCYEPRDTGRAKIGSTTTSEAQLIGRGARYYPFVVPDNPDRFRRKFDENLDDELRVIEELHYHSINDSRYIAEIRQALVAQGIMEEYEVTKELKLKEIFKKTSFYKYGWVYVNDRIDKNYRFINSFADLGVRKKNYVHVIATGHGGASTVLAEKKQGTVVTEETRKDLSVKNIEVNIVQSAIARSPFYTFTSLKRYFPNLTTMHEFITAESYLSGLEITFQGDIYKLDENKGEKLNATLGLLSAIEAEIRQQVTEYEGSKDFRQVRVHEVFTDKLLKFSKDNDRGKDDAQFKYLVAEKQWFAFETIYGTSEEKAFVRMLDRYMDKLNKHYEIIYLLRNEGHFAIYDFEHGQPFQPDFVLFLRDKTGKTLTYQLFIEPKGVFLKEQDRWKEKFLQDIKDEFGNKVLNIDDRTKYRLIGVPFYNNEDENRFKESMSGVLPFPL